MLPHVPPADSGVPPAAHAGGNAFPARGTHLVVRAPDGLGDGALLVACPSCGTVLLVAESFLVEQAARGVTVTPSIHCHRPASKQAGGCGLRFRLEEGQTRSI